MWGWPLALTKTSKAATHGEAVCEFDIRQIETATLSDLFSSWAETGLLHAFCLLNHSPLSPLANWRGPSDLIVSYQGVQK